MRQCTEIPIDAVLRPPAHPTGATPSASRGVVR